MSTFVSLAAYRDPQLVPTLVDLLTKANRPDDLRIAVCWQHGEDEVHPAIFDDPRILVADVPWWESRGACWARALLMAAYDGEDWFLQLDSHHRFVQGWDDVLVDQAAASGSERPVLTTYLPPFSPDEPSSMRDEPCGMEFGGFGTDGVPDFRPSFLGELVGGSPVPARFLSAHLLFAPGSFVADVPYDPDLYFLGEEITLAIRAFTNGYDLFHPSVMVGWHEYTRNYRTKHWDDHDGVAAATAAWHERDVASRRKVQRFLLDPWVGLYGCGTARTMADYVAYAGVSFRERRLQDHTRPQPPTAEPACATGLAGPGGDARHRAGSCRGRRARGSRTRDAVVRGLP